MLKTTLDEKNDIAILEPQGALSKADFINAAEIIDPFIEQHDKLNGVIIYTPSFPGWDSFAALVTHLKFIREHQRKITRLAFVTDSAIGSFVEKIGSHFVAAEVKTFPFNELDQAKQWILQGS